MKYTCKKCNEQKSKNHFGLFETGTLVCKECIDSFMDKYSVFPETGREHKEKRVSRQAIRLELVKALGSKCSKCGMSDIRCLQVDHIHGKGKKEIEEKGYYKMYLGALMEIKNGNFGNYQLLCANCNWIKRHTNNEIEKRSPKPT